MATSNEHLAAAEVRREIDRLVREIVLVLRLAAIAGYQPEAAAGDCPLCGSQPAAPEPERIRDAGTA